LTIILAIYLFSYLKILSIPPQVLTVIVFSISVFGEDKQNYITAILAFTILVGPPAFLEGLLLEKTSPCTI